MTNIISSISSTGVLHLQINRPEAKNALSLAMYQSLVDVLVQAEQDDKTKAVVISGNDQCFTAGNDLKDFLAGGELNEQHPTVKFLYCISQFKKPIIAAVAGPAIGIGTTMLLHCDMVFAAQNSLFQLPFAQLGLCPEAGSSYLLTKQVGHQKAFELMVLGEKFDAQTAVQLGIINQVTTEQEVINRALDKAKKLAQLPKEAVLVSKQLIKQQDVDNTQTAIKKELEHFQSLLNGDECKQIISGFFKRK